MIINNLLLTTEEIFSEIFESFEKKSGLLLTYLNQNNFNIYFKNKGYKELLDTKFKVYQADTGVFLFLKCLNKGNVTRIDATSVNKKILIKIIDMKIPICIIGSNYSEDFINEECAKRNINLAGYQHGYFNDSDKERIINKIKLLSSQVFFVGMGVPKQEIFASELNKALENKVIICVGNFLEFYFGTIKRSSKIFQKLGLEWMFRLITEPGRLWKRYLIGIPQFIFRSIKIILTKNYR